MMEAKAKKTNSEDVIAELKRALVSRERDIAELNLRMKQFGDENERLRKTLIESIDRGADLVASLLYEFDTHVAAADLAETRLKKLGYTFTKR